VLGIIPFGDMGANLKIVGYLRLPTYSTLRGVSIKIKKGI
jgi:hypothetical protein